MIPPIPYDWQEDAVCAEVGGDIFFPEHGESSLPAKQLCARCPVARQCLAGAVERGETWGIWGGVAAKNFHKVRGKK